MNNSKKSNDNDRESIWNSSEDLPSLVHLEESNFIPPPVTMETYPLLDDQDDHVNNSEPIDGYIAIQSRTLRQSPDFEKELKYPKNIDPFKIKRQIIFLSLMLIAICVLFGLSFTLDLFIPDKFIEFGICALMCLQFVLMMFYYLHSLSWSNFLSDSGFYKFPKIIHSKRTLVLFVWSLGAFFLSPILVLIKVLCDKDQPKDPDKICFSNFSNINVMQMYLGLESLLVLASLSWHLSAVILFRIQRRWPDIWHEQLLQESSLIDWCPLIKLSELRLEVIDEVVTVHHNNSACKRSSDLEIMQTQAYVIAYLRKLNNQLALRINHLSRELDSDLITRVNIESRAPQHITDAPQSSSFSSESCNLQKTGLLSLLS